MKKIARLLTMFLVAMVMFTSFPVQTEAAVKISKTKATVYVGSSVTLKITGTSKKVAWSTSNKKIAAVSSKGKVTGKKAGTATITAKVGKKSYKCKVTVKKPSLNVTKKTLYVGNTYTLKLTGTSIKSVKSSNNKVAAISKKGKVTAKKAGKTTITITGKDKKKYTCSITVKKPYLNITKKTLKVGENFTLKITGTTAKSWSSSNKKIATVNSKGKVTAIKAGTATITCKGKDGKSYTCKVTVKGTHKHTYKATIIKEATCQYTGIVRYECAGCGDSYLEDTPIVEHDYKEEILVQPNCEKEGKARYTCEGCGESFEGTLERTHEYEETYIKPTCTSNGGTCMICKLCDSMYVVEFEPKINHEYTASVIAPTCTTEGYTLHKCKNCDDNYIDTYTEMKPHDFETVICQEPTCEYNGYQKDICQNCGDWDRDSYVILEAYGHREFTLQVKNGKNCGVCKDCKETLFTIAYTNDHHAVANREMAYESGFQMYSVPGLSLEVEISNYVVGEIDWDKFMLVLEDGEYREETYKKTDLSGNETYDVSVSYYKNDIAEVYKNPDMHILRVVAKNRGTTEVTLHYDGKKVGTIPLNVNAYTFGEAIRRYAAGETNVTSGYTERYANMIKNAATILNEATTPDMTKHEKVLALLDWMEENIDYGDSLTILGGQKAWETLDVRQAVCGGYAESMSLFMDALEIPCYYLYSNGHAWNMVKVDAGNGKGEQWYYIDATEYNFEFTKTVDEMNAENAIPGVWGYNRAMGGYMIGNGGYMSSSNASADDNTPIDDSYISPLYE